MVVRANTLTTVLRVTFTDERCDSQALLGATVGSPAFRKPDVHRDTRTAVERRRRSA